MPPWETKTDDDDSALPRARSRASGIGVDDIRMAANSDIISDTQATSLTKLVRIRNRERSRTSAQEEPFELFGGFDEMFIVAGLLILASGWIGLWLALPALPLIGTVGEWLFLGNYSGP